MKPKNCRPGVEVVLKDDGSIRTILTLDEWKDENPTDWEDFVGEGRILLSGGAASYPSNLRLANKPKRSELVKRVEELENELGLVNGYGAMSRQEMWDEIQRVRKVTDDDGTSGAPYRLVESILEERDQLREDIDAFLNGTYFLTRPHREKGQCVANLTGLTITGDASGIVKAHRDRGVYESHNQEGMWYSSYYTLLPDDQKWTDEPFESRIVGPANRREDEAK